MIADLPPYVATCAVEDIVVYNEKTNEPLVLVGFVAWGSPADLSKLEAAAKQRGIRSARIEQEDPETMVLFNRDAPRGPSMAFWSEVVSGKYGKFRVEALIVTVADAKDGISGEELRKLDADAIRE